MARLGWGGSIATAAGVAAGAGAAQLGFGYGLGIIDWATDATTGEAAWLASLAWSTWIAGTSTIAGAVCAQRLRRAPAGPGEVAVGPVDAPSPAEDPATRRTTAEDPATRRMDDGGPATAIALALAGAVGALLTMLLVAVPARAVTVPGVAAPQTVAACYAGAGLLVGLLTAVWALRSPAAAANVIATVGWLWVLAVVAVLDGVLSGRGLSSAQLGIWQLGADSPSLWIRGWFYWPGAVLALGSAVLIGSLAARRTARSPQRRLGAAASGAAGPLLVALAYLLAVPGLTAIGREQVSAHLVAPYAVVAGFAGSVLAAALAQRAARRRPDVPVAVPDVPVAVPDVPVAVPDVPVAVPDVPVAIPRQRTGEVDDAPAGPPSEPVGSGGAVPSTGPAEPLTSPVPVGSAVPRGSATTGTARAAGETGPGDAGGVPAAGGDVAAERPAPRSRGARRAR
ncbi:hypothetical protein ACFY2R_00960 [Micromonospora olivasterospora]|uniref:Uncharacterized protein n=1 Tax=Micromonospora olivasterospora TaxID=1880 RepID=A0A562I946_MICOL|nr:hypothetical protein [Micromonospora olivasterospora]TWH67537.1 hypothetical protein JD77_02514 [Micromonospora olivasterospora]